MMKKAITILVPAALGFVLGVIVALNVSVSPRESPYLKDPGRLGDVVAALTVMGTYEKDAHTAAKWQEFIGGVGPRSAHSWEEVFKEHPEFFQPAEEGRWSLIWRRAQDKVWDSKNGTEFKAEELSRLSEADKNDRLARPPLKPENTAKLIDVAVSMQNQAIARRAELRWWVPILVGVICVFIGALLKS